MTKKNLPGIRLSRFKTTLATELCGTVFPFCFMQIIVLLALVFAEIPAVLFICLV